MYFMIEVNFNIILMRDQYPTLYTGGEPNCFNTNILIWHWTASMIFYCDML